MSVDTLYHKKTKCIYPYGHETSGSFNINVLWLNLFAFLGIDWTALFLDVKGNVLDGNESAQDLWVYQWIFYQWII